MADKKKDKKEKKKKKVKPLDLSLSEEEQGILAALHESLLKQGREHADSLTTFAYALAWHPESEFDLSDYNGMPMESFKQALLKKQEELKNVAWWDHDFHKISQTQAEPIKALLSLCHQLHGDPTALERLENFVTAYNDMPSEEDGEEYKPRDKAESKKRKTAPNRVKIELPQGDLPELYVQALEHYMKTSTRYTEHQLLEAREALCNASSLPKVMGTVLAGFEQEMREERGLGSASRRAG